MNLHYYTEYKAIRQEVISFFFVNVIFCDWLALYGYEISFHIGMLLAKNNAFVYTKIVYKKMRNEGKAKMYKQQKSGWLKHWDFAVLDIVCLELAFWSAYFICKPQGMENIRSLYSELSFMFFVFAFVSTLIFRPYSGVLKRDFLQEFVSTLSFVSITMAFELVFLFVLKSSETFSRAVILSTWMIAVVLIYFVRFAYKRMIFRYLENNVAKRSVVLLVGQENAARLLEELSQDKLFQYEIKALFFLDETPIKERTEGISLPLFYGQIDALAYLQQNVVDELFVWLPQGKRVPEDFMDVCRRAGIAVHRGLARKEEVFGTQSLEMFGNYYVLTSSIRVITPTQAALKRLMDICGAFIGLLFAGLIAIFVGPFIYFASPGPIVFSQTRVGRNGRSFKFYKFRSMYLDAEARKAELMAQNKMSGLMFKMDNDPRIIKGVGHFIRKTSLDEFPQFWNVLRGDMSLVGTRPPTFSEYEQYELNQKSRLAFKPGITGLWQISGRSDIVDFDEVVRLDLQYIETWTILEDVRILIKTVFSVLRQKGSE
ncbi:MAG: sugar transferase [Faecalibacterium sp.]